jgi:hypothetical protein
MDSPQLILRNHEEIPAKMLILRNHEEIPAKMEMNVGFEPSTSPSHHSAQPLPSAPVVSIEFS